MQWLKNSKVSTKMAFLSTVATIGLLIIGGISLWQTSKLSKGIENIYNWNVVPIEIVSNMKANQLESNTEILELIISKHPTHNQEYIASIDAKQQEIDTLRGQYNANIPVVIQMFEEFDELRKTYHNELAQIFQLVNTNKNSEALNIYTNQLTVTASKLVDVNTQLIDFNNQYAEDFYKSSKEEKTRSLIMQSIIIAVIYILVVLLCRILAKLITHPVNEMKSLLVEAAKGDFTVQGTYTSKDELGILMASFNDMLASIKEVIHRVRESSEQVASSSEELLASTEQTNHAAEHIAEASMDLAGGADTSLHGTYEATNSIKNMEDNITTITNSIANTLNNSKVTALEAEKGNTAIQSTVQQMQTVNDSVLQTANIIKSLNTRSIEIEKIVAVISDISDQTNLLALNAAIEAARAGEHGKGFAVVADEVRKLAEESRSSAEQITALIRDIQANTANAVSSMEKSTQNVETGMQLITTTSASFGKIYHSANDVSEQMNDVAVLINSITENAHSLAQQLTLVSQNAENAVLSTQSVASGAEQQLATIEEISASSHNLAKMADDLQKMVRLFKV
ncbi:methyl-accepting chemotaxis protein [Lysinibacillus piscis]|uniref:Methyl-accepting chemotaxis protein n=1 Tax=Lysinibacillus piscis TaxID=2518931 RepID=A0ABQ5NNG3_9BACI|nr:HAMP domain-containing methyl-accepting chemotaxis protein [Lysinibacillus sp. KH24]GLC89631.1 hypothetical protein LYSBPC_27580 [Lysinibacillus sp. KH24]